MGRNSKTTLGQRPNAPEFQQILQQPPHNPYYPDPSAALLNSPPPPPYSDRTEPIVSPTNIQRQQQYALSMAQMDTSNISYPRIQTQDARHGHVPIVIQSSTVPYDRRVERFNRRVRRFNNQTIALALLTILLSLWAYKLNDKRNCLIDFTVHKPAKDVTITVSTVRDMHIPTVWASGCLILFCLMKGACGYKDKSYNCYFLIMSLYTAALTMYTGYQAYLSLYSPCVPNDILSDIGRTALSKFVDHMPAPDKGMFGQVDVFTVANNDQFGVMIFLMDLMNVFFSLSIFLGSMTTC